MDKLAINGGTPACAVKFPSWPIWDETERTRLMEALDAGQWGTLGDRALAFAKRFSQYVGVRYGVALNSGTQSLELLLRALGVGYGDEVIVPAYTFVATVSAIAMTGAAPAFADIDYKTGNMSIKGLQDAITPRSRAVLLVHVAGRPCDMDAILPVARAHNLIVIEDGAHAHGCEWKGVRVGALGDAAAFSFQSSKNLTGGEGGAIVTNDLAIYENAFRWHNSGRAPESAGAGVGGAFFPGTNGRMAEWEAAILDAQMDRLDQQNDLREENAKLLRRYLADMDFVSLPPDDDRITKHGHYIFALRVNADRLRCGRDEFVKALLAEGVPCSAGYKKLSEMGFLKSENFIKTTGRAFDYASVPLPETDRLCADGMCLPGYALLADKGAIEQIAAAFDKAGRALEK